MRNYSKESLLIKKNLSLDYIREFNATSYFFATQEDDILAVGEVVETENWI